MTENANLYKDLNLMKRVLCGIDRDDPTIPSPGQPDSGFDEHRRAVGGDWPLTAHTMVGITRLDQLQDCIEDVLLYRVPGDFIETGVWRGGACIFMRAMLKAHDVTDRNVWVADSFAGLPVIGADGHIGDYVLATHLLTELAVPLKEVKANFASYDLLDDQVKFLPGWFSDTLPVAPVKELAILRLDGDLYSSTMDALENLYPKLSPGGFCIIDDYKFDSCKQAVNEYRAKHGIKDPVTWIDWAAAYWEKDGG